MESIKNYIKTKISSNKLELQEQYNNKEVSSNETIVLVKLLNNLKSEADTLTNENLSKEDILERSATIEKLGYILGHFKELDPVIQKFCAEKAQKEKFEEER